MRLLAMVITVLAGSAWIVAASYVIFSHLWFGKVDNVTALTFLGASMSITIAAWVCQTVALIRKATSDSEAGV